jgi:hypothetical protein
MSQNVTLRFTTIIENSNHTKRESDRNDRSLFWSIYKALALAYYLLAWASFSWQWFCGFTLLLLQIVLKI